MQGIENITGRIQADAQAEIDQILADAQLEADKLTAGYTARAERESAELLAKGAQSAQERGSRLVSAAQMEARKSTLAAKQEMLDKAFDLALDKLTQLDESSYIDLLAKLAAQAAPTGEEELIFNSTDRERIGAKVTELANQLLTKAGRKGGLTLSQQTRAIRGGLLLSDGAVEVNCALETLVRLSRTEVTSEVSQLLFG
jgi:V/A-type H+-transporting ATPase subunit E